ncbi:SPFH domain-containing protein [Luteococcus peritonei]|uniref:SPFH domain-containing protein n=1 Tax=Luteococcus peritonei TaxID=88874 RepID=A0ABW4RVZ2_9ACTN
MNDDNSTAVTPEEQPLQARPVGHDGVRVDVSEHRAWSMSGLPGLLLVVLLVLGGAALVVTSLLAGSPSVAGIIGGALLAALGGILATGLRVVNPGEAVVVQFLGNYLGTVRRTGLNMTPPFTTGRKVSVKADNFETTGLKVNDSNGNPIEIAAVVVYQVADTAKAAFAVEDYDEFVRKQAESALRHVAMSHPYDDHSVPMEGQPAQQVVTLRESPDHVNGELAREVAERVAVSGVEIIEVRISHLAYAQEIASAMLRRQQAAAVLSARQVIVQGATEMAKQAVRELDAQSDIELDPERKAAMITNLLVVLCSEQNTAPVINAGSLY